MSAGGLGLLITFLIKDIAFQQAFAGGDQQFGYGRINPSMGVGGLGLASSNDVGDMAVDTTPDVSINTSDPGELGSSRINQDQASTIPKQPMDEVSLNLTNIGRATGAYGPQGLNNGGYGGYSSGSNTEASIKARNKISPPSVIPGQPNPGGQNPVDQDKAGKTPLIGKNLIIVSEKFDASARSVEGNSLLNGKSFVAGLENSNLDFALEKIQHNTTRDIHTERDTSIVSASLLGSAELSQSLSQAAVFNSFVKGASVSGSYEMSARDLLSVLVDAGLIANARVDDQTFAMLDSVFVGGNGDDQLKLESDVGAKLKATGRPSSLNIDLDLASVGIRNSKISLGDGNDQLLIRANIVGDPEDQKDYGIDLDLPTSKEAIQGNIRINSSAIGADRGSVIDSGDGNDRIDILTAIDDYLEADLAPMHPQSTIKVDRNMVSLNQTILNSGAGDDFVVLRGDVVDSTINLGSGINQLFLQGELKGNSQILSEQDYVFVQLPLVRRSEVLTDDDDRWEISNLAEIQNVDGRAGNDTLLSSGQGNQDAVAITSTDRGHIWSTGFESIESLDLGDADDIVLVKNLGGLSGQIHAGQGIDTLDFSESWRAAEVDLHTGTSSHIAKGINSIEKVIGSDFDDAIILGWSPWLAELDEEGNGYDITGGKGADTFTLLGLGADISEQWNGTSGIPIFRDVDLDSGDRFAYSMDYNRDSVLMAEPNADHLSAAKQLPIAPLETLRNGWQQDGYGLGLAVNDGSHANPFSGELHLLGSDGPGTSRLVAYANFKELTITSGTQEGTESVSN